MVIKRDELMSLHTTLGIGGPAKRFIIVNEDNELIAAIKNAIKSNEPYIVIGSGSNLLVSDEKLPLVVIKNNICGMSKIRQVVTAKAGTPLQDLVDFTINNNMYGIHKMTGIPGTVGGAVYGNAGAYGQTISDYLTKIKAFDPFKLKFVELSKKDCGFSYRDSNFKQNGLIVCQIEFEFSTKPHHILKEECEEVLGLRLDKYTPGVKCPGSFFKNVLSRDAPQKARNRLPDYKDTFGKIPAWLFLNQVGAQGAKRGNIQISPNHSNLFINLGQGTATDFYNLAKEYADKVEERFGIKLEPEVRLVNLPRL